MHRAAWLLPIAAPPIRDGWVAVDAHRIVATGDPVAQAPAGAPLASPPFDHEPYAILPGLVNAHTHLELSWMAGLVPSSPSMPEWAGTLIGLRRSASFDPVEPIAEAIVGLRACGTSLVGDVTNTLAAHGSLMSADLSACIFRELFGFNAADPAQLVADAEAELDALLHMEWLRCSVVPHAPYSVSPDLFRAIARASRGGVVSVHVGESSAEVEFLRTGTGPWRRLLQRLGAWDPAWTPPACDVVEYLDRLGLVTDRLLAVHGVQLTDGELRRLAQAGATVVTCPRSNRWTGAGDPPISRFYGSGVRVAVGTDSLASVADLNLFNELAAIRAIAPGVPAARILESATRSGANALGFGDLLGTIEPRKLADLIAVRVPPDVRDVEEYLLSGISPADIRWLAAG
ncbi:MAG: amidohydrolase family protein [Vicinamibacterales bacterium]